jgi:hypothetical protein
MSLYKGGYDVLQQSCNGKRFYMIDLDFGVVKKSISLNIRFDVL